MTALRPPVDPDAPAADRLNQANTQMSVLADYKRQVRNEVAMEKASARAMA